MNESTLRSMLQQAPVLPVMVIEDPDDDVTIIWTFDAA